MEKVVADLKAMTLRMAGRRLPPERELAAMLGVGRPGLRRALAQLQEQGLVTRRQGSGTFAAEQGAGELGTVGVLVDERLRLGDDPFFTRALETLQGVLQEQGVRCLVHRLSSTGRCVILEDAVVTLGLAGEALVGRMRAGDVPAVGLFLNLALRSAARVSLLDLDDDAAGEQAAGRLMEEGCEAIVFAGHNTLPVSERRLAGAKRAAGSRLRVIDTGMNYAAGVEISARISRLAHGKRMGVVAANDWLALGLHHGLLVADPSLRQMVRIVGFDGLAIAAQAGIVSLEAPIEQIAMDAVAEIRRLSASPSARGRRIVYPMAWPTDSVA